MPKTHLKQGNTLTISRNLRTQASQNGVSSNSSVSILYPMPGERPRGGSVDAIMTDTPTPDSILYNYDRDNTSENDETNSISSTVVDEDEHGEVTETISSPPGSPATLPMNNGTVIPYSPIIAPLMVRPQLPFDIYPPDNFFDSDEIHKNILKNSAEALQKSKLSHLDEKQIAMLNENYASLRAMQHIIKESMDMLTLSLFFGATQSTFILHYENGLPDAMQYALKYSRYAANGLHVRFAVSKMDTTNQGLVNSLLTNSKKGHEPQHFDGVTRKINFDNVKVVIPICAGFGKELSGEGLAKVIDFYVHAKKVKPENIIIYLGEYNYILYPELELQERGTGAYARWLDENKNIMQPHSLVTRQDFLRPDGCIHAFHNTAISRGLLASYRSIAVELMTIHLTNSKTLLGFMGQLLADAICYLDFFAKQFKLTPKREILKALSHSQSSGAEPLSRVVTSSFEDNALEKMLEKIATSSDPLKVADAYAHMINKTGMFRRVGLFDTMQYEHKESIDVRMEDDSNLRRLGNGSSNSH